MTTSIISLNNLDPPALGEALRTVRQGLEDLGIDFYLVGAVARDLYMNQVYQTTVNRTTLDLDIALLVANTEEYENLKQHLIDKYAFIELTTNAFALKHPNNITVDLMPFGGIADADNKVRIQGKGMTSISVPGIAEAYEEAGELQTEEGQRWQVCTLPGMCVLKLLAWQDRPESRRKDLQDLAHIITHYDFISQDDLFDRHFDLLNEEEGFENSSTNYMLNVTVRLLGRHMQSIVSRSELLRERIITLLENPERLSEAWAKANNCTIATAVEILTQLKHGLTDKLPE